MSRFDRLLLGALLMAGALRAAPLLAQNSPIQNFRLLDSSGQPVEKLQIEAGDEYYPLPEGVTEFKFAFDFAGTQAEEIKLRVLGTQGTAFCPEETRTLDAPGPQEFTCTDQGRPIQPGEYFINLYVGKQTYLADSLLVYVGDVKPAPSVATQEASNTQVSATPGAATDAVESPGEPGVDSTIKGPSPALLVMAGLGLVALTAIVIWAARSATRRG